MSWGAHGQALHVGAFPCLPQLTITRLTPLKNVLTAVLKNSTFGAREMALQLLERASNLRTGVQPPGPTW